MSDQQSLFGGHNDREPAEKAEESHPTIDTTPVKPIPCTGIQDKWTIEDDRVMEYRKWRMGLKVGKVQDIDQLEYKIVDGQVIPLAILELTKVEGCVIYPERYLYKIEQTRVKQMMVTTAIARYLNIPAYYVVFEDGVTLGTGRMWNLRLHDRENGWTLTTIERLEEWLRNLHR